MTQGTGISTEALRARLQERLAPTQLEVLDLSAAHLGHAGEDGTGVGTHFGVHIALPGCSRGAPRWRATACL